MTKVIHTCRFFLMAVMLVLASCRSGAQEQKHNLTWYTDINQAYDLSRKEHKPVFGFFTGSDWCGWCHKLEAVVFDKPGFQAWAKKNVILLELDFPRGKKLPEQLTNQNNSLQQFFKVQGYPTVWIFDLDKTAEGQFNITPRGSLGYPRAEDDKAEASFLETARGILKNKQVK